ncbi:hypothetical protein CR513_19349, partial [Mucuna pruriens]
MKVMENLARRAVIKIEEGRGNLIKGIYSVMHVKSGVTLYSNHMIVNKRWFVNLDEKVKRMMKFVDNSTFTAEGMGKVPIHRRDR